MPATFQWTQANLSAEVLSDLGISGNLVNFKKNDSSSAADYADNPINAGDNSMEVYLKPKFTGTFNTIDNIQFWRSTQFSPATGLDVQWDDGGLAQGSYATPVSAASTKATSAVPSADPGSANVSIGGNPTGNLSASGYADYIVMQLQTTSAAAAGDTSLATFTLNYDES